MSDFPNLLTELIIKSAFDKKAENIVLLDMREVSPFFDFFIILTGLSKEHMKAIAKHIVSNLEEKNIGINHIEGEDSNTWVLIDCVDVIVHIFNPESRIYYNLEGLWGDVPTKVYEPDTVKSKD